MTDKFTIRDILSYTMLGLIGLIFLYLHKPTQFEEWICKAKDYSDLVILLIVPLSYIIGHLIMSIDDVIFNGILLRLMPNRDFMHKKKWQLYNFVFFGYRNIGIRNRQSISNEDFFKTCDKLRSEDNFSNAEYFQVMSDLFKGILLVILFSIIIDIFEGCFVWWKLLFAFLTWYRAKSFSAYFVAVIKRRLTN